ncbi:40S ribosomal protein S25 [Tritrichomonas foetus]|uniref:40S ribosomal protein S25 n=1 Tax=Tritrichomonas foetus TaxID=1144522 RepID=A0A1J4KDT3_9EUKA|nr:40S ribosomal protein S25 [Tritrichomonas foetus]|eukprot:OHT07621.1 40S ribosomal protein S25 [Tritrichomonas foetus]
MSGIKKKWTKTTNKEKRDWATVLLTEIAEDVEKNVPKSKLITPAKLAERYKVSLTVARKVLAQLEADGKMVCLIHTSTLRAYGRVGDAPAEEVVEEKPAPTKKQPAKKQPAKK